MLTHIHIENYTLVHKLNMDFEAGLNILTGETGAGKSLWMDAVTLALGARCDASIIRHDAESCIITVCFDITHNPAAQAWLKEHDISHENSCVLRRCIYRDRASKSTLNDYPCTQQLIRTLAPLLISIHGQHHHQMLLKTDAHRQMLDTLSQAQPYLDAIAQHYTQWQANQKQIDQLKSQMHNHDDQLALLQFHLNEIESLHLQEGEWEQINQEHRNLHHAQTRMQAMEAALQLLSEQDDSVLQQLERVQSYLTAALRYDEALEPITKLIESAHIDASEAFSELQSHASDLDLSPEKLAETETRLGAIHTLARKHHIEPNALTDHAEKLRQQIDALTHSDAHLANLEKAQANLLTTYQIEADKLTACRKKYAKQLEKTMTEDMRALGMEGGQFKVVLEPLHAPIARHGQERIIFYVSTNPGQPAKPLQDIVSGGELSRLSLALHRLLAQKQQQPTLIFDEVDTGIGGETADRVGALLKNLSTHCQLLCITHLPQIASLADQHYKAMKQTHKKQTETTMVCLDHHGRIEELARMLGGTKVTTEIRQHAKQLLTA